MNKEELQIRMAVTQVKKRILLGIINVLAPQHVKDSVKAKALKDNNIVAEMRLGSAIQGFLNIYGVVKGPLLDEFVEVREEAQDILERQLDDLFGKIHQFEGLEDIVVIELEPSLYIEEDGTIGNIRKPEWEPNQILIYQRAQRAIENLNSYLRD